MMATTGRRQHPVPQPSATPPIIEILDVEEDEGNPCLWLFHRGGKRSSPITVEDYTEDVLVQRAIVESIASSVRSIIDVDAMADCDVEVIEDRKGNGIKQRGRRGLRGSLTEPSIREQGESSSARCLRHPFPMGAPSPLPPLLPTVLCAICMEVKLLSECSAMKGCAHLFCSDCISQYVAAKVQENVTAVKCPQPGCKDGSLEPEMCRTILPAEVFDRWCTALCEALFVGEERFYCPFKDCSALLIDDAAFGSGGGKGSVVTDSECPHCHRLFCAQCKVPWHAGVTCNVFQSLGADERGREDILLMEMAQKSKWQRCPKCKFYVERTEGCMFIQCRCGFRFCYGCASPMIINHYCTKCRR